MHIALVLIVVIVVAYLLLRKPVTLPADPCEVEGKLLHLCLGDREVSERLIAAELSRDPGITRVEAVDRAYSLLCRSKR
jgi:hypothetical protein